MNYENILNNDLTIFIIYKAIIGSFTSLKYIFFIWLGLLLYFRGLKRGGFFYRQIIQNEGGSDVYLIRPLKEYL